MATLLIFDLIHFKFIRERCVHFIFTFAGLPNIVNLFMKYVYYGLEYSECEGGEKVCGDAVCCCTDYTFPILFTSSYSVCAEHYCGT